MTLPHRIWNRFYHRTLEAIYDGAPDSHSEWTTVHYPYAKVGNGMRSASPTRLQYLALILPSDDDGFGLFDGANAAMKARLLFNVMIEEDTSAPQVIDVDIIHNIMSDLTAPTTWDRTLVTGRQYDGVNNWIGTPPTMQSNLGYYQNPLTADLPYGYESVFKASSFFTWQEQFFREGMCLFLGNYNPAAPDAAGEYYYYNIIAQRLIVNYFNPIVNSITPAYSRDGDLAGLILSGLGFDNNDAEIDEGGPAVPGGWNDEVDFVHFVGLQGQGTTTYQRALGHFTITDNATITFNAAAPALPNGSYHIQLEKRTVNLAGDVFAYAGDWRCDASGRMYRSTRHTFVVSDTMKIYGDFRERSGTQPVLLSEWEIKDSDGNITFKQIAPIDVRTPTTIENMGNQLTLTDVTAGLCLTTNTAGLFVGCNFRFDSGDFDGQTYEVTAVVENTSFTIDADITDVGAPGTGYRVKIGGFYDGLIKSCSSLSRSIDDRTGLYNVSDMTVELANDQMEFSRLLSTHFLKNQGVSLWLGWGEHPEAWKTNIIKAIIDDYTLKGKSFNVILKDYTQKYFKIKVPRYLCTADEYPNIHESAVGKAMPEALGLNAFTGGEAPGAMEALYIDTTAYKYLATRGSLHSITAVYSDGDTVNPANYAITYEDGGRTYITFSNDQEDSKITYDSTGYMYDPWNSTNGYVQNPAYILAFFLAFIAEMPIALLDLEAVDDLADIYDALGASTAGRFILQDEQDIEAVLEGLLFTYGAKFFPTSDGRFKIARKDITNYQTDFYIFDQIDLYDFAQRQYNLREAVNLIKAQYDFYPTANYWVSTYETSSQKSIADYEAEIEPSSPWGFEWTDSEAFVIIRAREELIKVAYGDYETSFAVSMCFVDQLEIFDNFRLQDPFGLSPTGAGEVGRYYYITSLTFDFNGQSIGITAIDLQWLLRQYMIVGKCDEIAGSWMDATEYMRMYAYVGRCTEGTFPDGEPNKKVMPCI